MDLFSLRKRILVLVLMGTTTLLLVPTLLGAYPPSPHGLAGWIFDNDGSTQVPLGTPFRVNNTNNSFFLQDTTSVPVPSHTGRYSVSVNATDNDLVFIYAWFSQTYGETNISIVGDMDNVNVTINRLRPPEANVSIYSPPDSEEYNTTDTFTVNATINIVGGQSGTNCNITLSISSESVFTVVAGDTYVRELGNINLGVTKEVYWNITGVAAGVSDFTVTGICANSRYNFDGKANDTIHDITALGDNPPSVELIAPANNTINKSSHNITFSYSVTHPSDIANCTLILNGVENESQFTPESGATNNISIVLQNGWYNWSVTCTDMTKVSGNSITNYFNVSVYYPSFLSTTIDSPIDLEAGAAKVVYCNTTVTDQNGAGSIGNVNATLYNIVLSNSQDNDNANWHYTNSSCTRSALESLTANYTCSFQVEYYAYNGSWNCSLSITDNESHTNSSQISTTINDLVAISSNNSLNYGAVQPGLTSTEKAITLTNIGNVKVNISTNGYGDSESDGFSMVCEQSQTIDVKWEHYSVVDGTTYDQKTNLSTTIASLSGLQLLKRTNEAGFGSDRNQTVWQMGVPKGIKQSSCNGTLVFYASLE